MKKHLAPDRVFAILHTPSAIRVWWSAARAIVLPRGGGIWMAAWGADEDSPDYVTSARIKVFEPPRRLVLGDFLYYAKTGPLPFQAEFTTEFSLSDSPKGAVLKVVQDGFPIDCVADDCYAGCETGRTIKCLNLPWPPV